MSYTAKTEHSGAGDVGWWLISFLALAAIGAIVIALPLLILVGALLNLATAS